MLTDIYVREKLREMSRDASRRQRVTAGSLDVPFAVPIARCVGMLFCRIGERLQRAGALPDRDVHDARSREHGLRLRRTD